MLRRLHPEQPESFAFTPANRAWAEAQITKYPEGRQASAIIPLLWRAQEQEGWLSRPAIEAVAEMLDMAYIRALEVATFYFMFQLQPVGSVAHIQICGTTSCMICGAEDLIAICKSKIAGRPHELSADGKFSWEEVECLGACANAPMAQIGKDYYEDLTAEKLAALIDALAAGKFPQAGPQNGRFAAEPAKGLTSLTEYVNASIKLNASAQLADEIGDTVKRIDGTEVPLTTPWLGKGKGKSAKPATAKAEKPAPVKAKSAEAKPVDTEASPKAKAKPADAAAPSPGTKPAGLEAARGGKPDDLKKIKGIGPKLEKLCNRLGFYHFDQIAAWTDAEVAWVDDNLEGFKGRVTRDEWVAQAKTLASGE
ncbi:NADH-quinone oxidoreductase subunit E [Thalassococcus sp. CAU 1522]|uniref:NADH-quinone oxidoreductase subunit E n=1 Tax=Thalassococcus arenae TaxID=2851652 RepID=A0ABS6N976_9RHOB|nr:NADH-quinone oxidoreductase subunit E [Thalassococcus arenae]MBV2360562.1 NADH-quinone oxidoreductase subunit E [Thalassococcus arenae]